jgi:hypothetical protein
MCMNTRMISLREVTRELKIGYNKVWQKILKTRQGRELVNKYVLLLAYNWGGKTSYAFGYEPDKIKEAYNVAREELEGLPKVNNV